MGELRVLKCKKWKLDEMMVIVFYNFNKLWHLLMFVNKITNLNCFDFVILLCLKYVSYVSLAKLIISSLRNMSYICLKWIRISIMFRVYILS